MASTDSDEIVLAYDDLGDPGDPVVIGLQGLAEGRKFWPEALVNTIVSSGYRLLLIDNRDIGDSSVLQKSGRVDLVKLVMGGGESAPYLLTDMAQDTIRLMDDLAIDRAHILGYSLGGMIGQWLAIEQPRRVQSLTLLMSSSGAEGLPSADPEAGAALMHLADPDDGQPRLRIETLWQTIQGQRDEDGSWFVELLLDCGYRPDAVNRQLAAGLASPPRHELLSALRCPSLVLHGTHDRMFPFVHGEDLAARLPGGKLIALEGAGHALSDDVIALLTPSLMSHLAAAEGVAA